MITATQVFFYSSVTNESCYLLFQNIFSPNGKKCPDLILQREIKDILVLSALPSAWTLLQVCTKLSCKSISSSKLALKCPWLPDFPPRASSDLHARPRPDPAPIDFSNYVFTSRRRAFPAAWRARFGPGRPAEHGLFRSLIIVPLLD